MIQLRMLKNLSRTLLIVLLMACLFLVHGGVAVVYSEGVTINMSGLQSTVSGGLIINAHGGYFGTQTQTTPNVQNNSEIQNAISSVVSTISSAASTHTNSSTTTSVSTLTTSTSVSQKYVPAAQALITSYNTPEHTTEITHPINFSTLSENEPLLPQAESYAVTVCLSYNDTTASGCADKKTPAQASEKLASMILNKYLKGVAIRPFRVVMPASVPPDQQIQLLRKIETEAIALIETTLLDNLKNSKRFSLETDAGKKQMKKIIIQDAQRAREDAENGNNWLHHSKDDRTSHEFQTAKAFRQFNNNISIADLINH